jgi:hypothetical protein
MNATRKMLAANRKSGSAVNAAESSERKPPTQTKAKRRTASKGASSRTVGLTTDMSPRREKRRSGV